MTSEKNTLLCPSAPLHEGALVVGVFETSETTRFLSHSLVRQPVTRAMLDDLEGVDTTKVLRVAAPCSGERCKNSGGGSACTLASKVVTWQPSAQTLPRCSIRTDCLWWHQEGKEACFRCPTVKSRQPGLAGK
jgi:hypothetical protein